MNDFRATVISAVKGYSPTHEYEAMNDKQLLFCLVTLRAIGRDTLARLILVTWPDADLERLGQETLDLLNGINWRLLDRLYEITGSPVPAIYLVTNRIEQDAICEQTSKHLRNSRVGSEFLRHYGNRSKPNSLADFTPSGETGFISRWNCISSDFDLRGK